TGDRGRAVRPGVPERRGRGGVRVLLLARGCARTLGAGRRSCRAHGGALRSCERRRPLLRGGRSAFGCVPRQLPAGVDTPGTDQRGGRDRRGVEVIVWGALAGGAVGGTVLASGYRLAQELGWTRMDIPF